MITFEKSSAGLVFFRTPSAHGHISKQGKIWEIRADKKSFDGSTIKSARWDYGWTLKEAQEKTQELFA